MRCLLLLSPLCFLISTCCVAGEPIWQPYTPQFGSHLDVAFTWSPVLWPWSGWISIFISVRETAYNWEGVAQGKMSWIFFCSSVALGHTTGKTLIAVLLAIAQKFFRTGSWKQIWNMWSTVLRFDIPWILVNAGSGHDNHGGWGNKIQ